MSSSASIPVWIPIVSALCGGLMSLLGTMISLRWTAKREINNQYRDIFVKTIMPNLIKPIIEEYQKNISSVNLIDRTKIIQIITDNIEYLLFCPSIVRADLLQIHHINNISNKSSNEKNKEIYSLLKKIHDSIYENVKTLYETR